MIGMTAKEEIIIMPNEREESLVDLVLSNRIGNAKCPGLRDIFRNMSMIIRRYFGTSGNYLSRFSPDGVP